MHADRNIRVHFNSRLDEVTQYNIIGVSAGTAAGLQNNRRLGFGGRRHDRQHLFHVIDVEGWNAVTMFGCVVQHLTH